MNNSTHNESSGDTPSMTSKSPSESEYEDLLMEGHEYDGIREYDNPIPPWLSLIFVGTIIWSFFYVVAINLGYIDRYEENLEDNQRAIAALRREAQSDQKELSPKLLARAADKSERVEDGKEIFTSKCASCHGKQGGGQVGPNLTDKYWIHGGKLMDIYRTVAEGVQKKGMPPWKSKLEREDIIDVVAFVRSLRGTNPPDPKEPQGDPYEPDSEDS